MSDLRLPWDMNGPQERAAALKKQAKRKRDNGDRLTPEGLKRVEQVDEEYWTDAVAFTEGLMERFQRTLDKAFGGNGSTNHPVAFTQGRSLALTGLLARLWTNQKVADHFADERMAALEKRVAELEARPLFEDAGVWAEGKSYRCGNGVTENGSYWLAKRNTTFGEKPGASDAWRLAVKRGRDGKDVRT